MLTQVGTGLLRVGVIDMKMAFKVLSVRMLQKNKSVEASVLELSGYYYAPFWRAGLLQVCCLLVVVLTCREGVKCLGASRKEGRVCKS